MTDLKGKVALITGGGTGIGDAVARRFVEGGAKVGVVGRRAELLRQRAQEIGALALPGDVVDRAAMERSVAQLVEQYGGLDIVVNNAATVAIGSVEQIDDAAWSSVMDVNLNGPRHLARIALPHLRARGGGTIVNVASVAALRAAIGSAAYGTAKAALIALTQSMACDFGWERIRVNALCPGWVDTPMVEPALKMLAEVRGITMDEARKVLAQGSPLQRMATPDEIARCVEFLATDASSCVNGAVLVADGGQSIVDLGTLPLAPLRGT